MSFSELKRKGIITYLYRKIDADDPEFIAKTMDSFVIWSDKSMYHWHIDRPIEVTESRFLVYAARLGEIGTFVMMKLENETTREINEIFDTYADVDLGFVRTIIPIRAACFERDPFSRSQARRILQRLEEFTEVIFDFSDVDIMGQGFSDKIFRVYASAHPSVKLLPRNMNASVLRMVRHVGRGHLPENVLIE